MALARPYLREAISYEAEMCDPRVSWAMRHTADRKEIVPMPGWPSTVYFSTPE